MVMEMNCSRNSDVNKYFKGLKLETRTKDMSQVWPKRILTHSSIIKIMSTIILFSNVGVFRAIVCKSIKTSSKVALRIRSEKHRSYKNGRPSNNYSAKMQKYYFWNGTDDIESLLFELVL